MQQSIDEILYCSLATWTQPTDIIIEKKEKQSPCGSRSTGTLGDTDLLCQGSCLSQQSCKAEFWCNDLQIMAVTCFYCPTFPCTFRQHNHPFIGNKHFPFLWGMQRKETINSSKGGSCIISNKCPGTVEWGRTRWEEQNRLSVEFLEISTSQSPVFQLFP